MNNNRKFKKYIQWYIMLIIPLLGTLIFNIYPLFDTLMTSFKNSNGEFINIVNYQILFKDENFIVAVKNTLYMAVLGVGFSILFAFPMANMLHNIKKGKSIYKIIFLLPMIMSMVTVANLFKYLMMPNEAGILNYIMNFFGFQSGMYFNDPSTARESVVALALWKGIGYNVILFFAGLQVVPVELYEAADIDGANEWNKWTNITIPCMKNTFTFVLITATIGALKRFTEIYAISGETGNPANALSTIMLYIYKNSFSTMNYKDLGRASAASIVLFIIILIFTIFNFVLTSDKDKRREKKEARKAMKIEGGR